MKIWSIFILVIFSSLGFGSVFAFEKLWYVKDEKRGIEGFQKFHGKIDIVAPQTYFLKQNGVVTGSVPTVILNTKEKINKNLKIMPLLANITHYKDASGKQKEYFNRNIVHNLLDNPKNWEKVSKFMREEAYKYGYLGWQLDLENIDVNRREKLNEFVKYLKSEFDKDGLKLSIAVVSKISDDEKDYKIYEKRHPNYWKYWAGVFDYKTLGENTDFISVMIYDQPNSPGPVATLDWSKQVIEYAKTQIPQEKISFGIPSYGWAYRSVELAAGKSMFSMVDFDFTNSKINNYNKKDTRNTTTGAGVSKIFGDISWVSYNAAGKNYTIWYEDVNSFKKKFEQIKSLAPNAHGFSVWVLGDEDKNIWGLF
jgi:spore germination protein YaaH